MKKAILLLLVCLFLIGCRPKPDTSSISKDENTELTLTENRQIERAISGKRVYLSDGREYMNTLNQYRISHPQQDSDYLMWSENLAAKANKILIIILEEYKRTGSFTKSNEYGYYEEVYIGRYMNKSDYNILLHKDEDKKSERTNIDYRHYGFSGVVLDNEYMIVVEVLR